MENKPLNAALYLRKSRAEEGLETDEVLARHRAALERCAAERGLRIAEVYPEVVSGESLCTRPQMLRLLEDVEQDRFDCLLCMDLDRLSRGRMRDQGLILDTCKAHSTRIVTPDKVYDLSDEQDEEYAELKTFLARREYQLINKRLRRGLDQAVREGCYCANAPYGYRNVTVDRRPTLAVCEEEARFVRMMFRLRASGWSCGAIADRLNGLGARPRRSDRFCRNSVRNILSAPVYAGKIVWNRSRNGEPQPLEHWTVAEGLHPALVSPALFAACQADPVPVHRVGTVRNPLAGLVCCARCGARMQMTGGSPWPYLACPTRGCCAAAQLPLVEQRVLSFLAEPLSALSLAPLPPDPEDETLWKTALSCAKLRVTALRRQRARLHDLLELGEYDLPTFRARLALLSAKEEQARRSLKEARQHLAPPPPEPSGSLWQACAQGDPGFRRALYRALLKEILYTREKPSKPGEFTLEFHFRPL